MKNAKRIFSVGMAVTMLLALTACDKGRLYPAAPSSEQGKNISESASFTLPENGSETSDSESDAPKKPVSEPNRPEPSGGQDGERVHEAHPYLAGLVASIVEEISTPEMSEYEKTKAAFDYMITHVSMGEPVGLELWCIHGGGDTPIPLFWGGDVRGLCCRPHPAAVGNEAFGGVCSRPHLFGGGPSGGPCLDDSGDRWDLVPSGQPVGGQYLPPWCGAV